MLFGEPFHFGIDGAGGAGNKTDEIAIRGRFDQRFAPPAQTDNGRLDHERDSLECASYGFDLPSRTS
jgi:hypothetical protein